MEGYDRGTREIPPHFKALEEIECEGVRHATGWYREYGTPDWRNRATKDQKRKGWEMAVQIEKILCAVLDEAHKRQVEEVIYALSEEPEGLYERLG